MLGNSNSKISFNFWLPKNAGKCKSWNLETIEESWYIIYPQI